MNLFHTTPIGNRASIRRLGLLAKFARGMRKAVWFHRYGDRWWAAAHVSARHCEAVHRLVRFSVDVPSWRVKRHGCGLYYVEGDLEADCISGCEAVVSDTSF